MLEMWYVTGQSRCLVDGQEGNHGKEKKMLDYLLPIGSVVKLRNGKKKVMIYGVKQTDAKTDITYDYVGVLYPEGNIGQEYQLLFSHDAIEEIYFRGYENEERKEFIKKLSNIYSQEKGE